MIGKTHVCCQIEEYLTLIVKSLVDSTGLNESGDCNELILIEHILRFLFQDDIFYSRFNLNPLD